MKWIIRYTAIVLFLVLVTGCGGMAQSGTNVWIDVPVNNLVLENLQPIQVEGHAASPGGISKVEVFINGQLLATVNNPAAIGELANFAVNWTADQPGEHIIQSVAYGKDGSVSEPDTAVVRFGEIPAGIPAAPVISVTPLITPVISLTPTITFTPPPTDTPTATPTRTSTPRPEAEIEFWADPAEINAGECTMLRWNVSNVSVVVFGGIEQPFSGSDQECPCENRTYTLKATLQDGTNIERTVSVNVNGSCATEVPPDTSPPPVPSPQVPANGLTIGCKASQSLAWLPVSDPSKIQEYQVEIQRSSDNSSWSAAPGSPKNGLTDKTTTIGVECGWYYRWRVRAIDGVGNISDWSGWSTFAVTLN